LESQFTIEDWVKADIPYEFYDILLYFLGIPRKDFNLSMSVSPELELAWLTDRKDGILQSARTKNINGY